jgi:hypothetical protein
VTLLAATVGRLRERGTRFALIGAAALAVHGVSRATRDLDLLVVDGACLDPAYWAPLAASGIEADVRRGDAADPLAGVVRLRRAQESPVDLVVGRHPWQADVLAGAVETDVLGVAVPVAGRADLILLKLFAAGPQDAWDVEQLLAGPERAATVAAVDRRVIALPEDSRTLWGRLRGRDASGRRAPPPDDR